uniref:Methyltransferase domain-containing protein n=1 Tax=Photinus pyralis TaxID=7054 RepID=A0A1Y1L9G0_PHOPY
MNNPELYDTAGKVLDAQTESIVKNYILQLLRNGDQKVVLDVGSGPGCFSFNYLYKPLSAEIKEMIGIDQSENMVTYANKHYGNDKLKFVKLNIETDCIPEQLLGRFDYVFSFWALHFLHDYTRGFNNIFKMMKPGGYALMVFPGSGQLYDIYKTVWTKPKWSKLIGEDKLMNMPFHNCENPENKLSDISRTAGFESLRCEIQDLSIYLTLETAKDYFASIIPVFSDVPKHLQEELINDHIKEWAPRDISLNEDVMYGLDYKLMVINARK